VEQAVVVDADDDEAVTRSRHRGAISPGHRPKVKLGEDAEVVGGTRILPARARRGVGILDRIEGSLELGPGLFYAPRRRQQHAEVVAVATQRRLLPMIGSGGLRVYPLDRRAVRLLAAPDEIRRG